MTDFEELLEHEAFMEELRVLVERIFWKYRSIEFDAAKHAWDDIKKYGDEPVFTQLFFEKLREEYEAAQSKNTSEDSI